MEQIVQTEGRRRKAARVEDLAGFGAYEKVGGCGGEYELDGSASLNNIVCIRRFSTVYTAMSALKRGVEHRAEEHDMSSQFVPGASWKEEDDDSIPFLRRLR